MKGSATNILASLVLMTMATVDVDGWMLPAPKPALPSNVAAAAARRDFLHGILAIGAGIATTGVTSSSFVSPAGALGDEVLVQGEEALIDVYFGCGCFWHVQHEFVEAEQRLLKRDDVSSVTARTGYAGGKAKDSLVCYHNAMSKGDYGKLGHAEVVSVRIPPSKFPDFAAEYFKLFNDKGDRPDQFGDVGTEYRNLVGVPGGAKSVYGEQLVQASLANGDKLDFAKGKGNDKDARAVTYVMDTAEFPFYTAEQYHQFHDGFNFGENYPNSYNNMASTLAESGKLEKSLCPNGTFGLGVAGL
jgi:peptide methionine sulfoxide reductase MsrA